MMEPPLSGRGTGRLQFLTYLLLLMVYWWVGFWSRISLPSWVSVSGMENLVLLLQVSALFLGFILFIFSFSLIWGHSRKKQRSKAKQGRSLSFRDFWVPGSPRRFWHALILACTVLGILCIIQVLVPGSLTILAASTSELLVVWFCLLLGFTLLCLLLFSGIDGFFLLLRVSWRLNRPPAKDQGTSEGFNPSRYFKPTGSVVVPSQEMLSRPAINLPFSFRRTTLAPPQVPQVPAPASASITSATRAFPNRLTPSYRVNVDQSLDSSPILLPESPTPTPANPADTGDKTAQPEAPSPTVPVGLVVYAQVLVTGGIVRLSFVLRNRTPGDLFQIRIFPRIPEALHIFMNVPPVPRVQSGERLEVSYEVEPSTSGEFFLGGDLLYEDAGRHPQWINIPPVTFAVKCPPLNPLRLNLAQIRANLPRMSQAHREYLLSDLPRVLLEQVTHRTMASFNLNQVERLQGTDPLAPAEAWFAGESPSKKASLYAQLTLLANPARVHITAWVADDDTVTGFLARFTEVLMTELAIVRHLQDQARDNIRSAARIGELLVTLEDFCMIEWRRADTRVKLQELANLLPLFDASTPVLDEVQEWVQKLSAGGNGDAAPQNLSAAEREQLEAALVKWKDAIEQLLAKFSLQFKEVTPSAVPA